jgi:hypothetical protein
MFGTCSIGHNRLSRLIANHGCNHRSTDAVVPEGRGTARDMGEAVKVT